jgi:hypothetical protein
MKSEEWKSYRTRFLINAKQLNSSLSFTDHLGRQHRGRKGDYLVESSDGVVSIAPRRIFEDIYVLMPQQHEAANAQTPGRETTCETVSEAMIDRPISRQKFASLEIQRAQPGKSSVSRLPTSQAQVVGQDSAVRAQRKLPQPCRDRSSPGSRLGLM